MFFANVRHGIGVLLDLLERTQTPMQSCEPGERLGMEKASKSDPVTSTAAELFMEEFEEAMQTSKRETCKRFARSLCQQCANYVPTNCHKCLALSDDVPTSGFDTCLITSRTSTVGTSTIFSFEWRIEHFGAGRCDFNGIWSVYEFEPLIFHGMCNILVLFAAVWKLPCQRYLQHV